jgi:hypothetical protein
MIGRTLSGTDGVLAQADIQVEVTSSGSRGSHRAEICPPCTVVRDPGRSLTHAQSVFYRNRTPCLVRIEVTHAKKYTFGQSLSCSKSRDPGKSHMLDSTLFEKQHSVLSQGSTHV